MTSGKTRLLEKVFTALRKKSKSLLAEDVIGYLLGWILIGFNDTIRYYTQKYEIT
jgi:hypothetical protein